MIPRKFVERGMRALPLLLIPIVLAPLLLLVVWRPAPKYESNATVWVSEPAGLESRTPASSTDPDVTPAERHLQVLTDLLATRAFRDEVAVEAKLVDPESLKLMTRERAEAARNAAADTVVRSTKAQAEGVNLLTISGARPSPEGAQALVGAIVGRLQGHLQREAERVNNITMEYFDRQLGVAREELDRRNAEFTAYLERKPATTSTATDPTYNSLLARVRMQEDIVDDLALSRQKAQFEAASTSQGLAARFNVIDAPTLPAQSVGPSTVMRLGYAAAAAALGAFVALVYLYLTYRTDHTIRSTEDLRGAGVPMLGYLPNVTPPWYRRRRGAPPISARRLAAAIVGGRAQQRRA